MADLSLLSQEQLDELDKKFQDRKRQGDVYRQVKRAEDTERLANSAGNLMAEGARAQEVARAKPVDNLTGALEPKYAPRSTSEANEIVRRAADAGAKVTTQPGLPVSTDIEGALKRGGREIVAGDQRLVVTPDHAQNPMATRDEAPPLTKHLRAFLGVDDVPESNKPSFLGVLGNTLGAPARVAATGVNIGADVFNGGDLRPFDIPGELLSAANNEGNVTGGNGRVATRGSGFGDVVRSRRDRMLKENPNAELGDLLAGLGTGARGADVPLDAMRGLLGGLGTAGDGIENANMASDDLPGIDPKTKLRDLSDDAIDNYGTFFSLFLDPLNVVPFEKLPGALSKTARAAGAAPVADAIDKVRRVATAPIPFLTSRGGRVESELAQHLGGGLAKEAGGFVDDAARRAAAERNVANVKAEKVFGEAIDGLTYEEAQQAMRAIDGSGVDAIEVRPWAEQQQILSRAAATSGKKLSTADQHILANVGTHAAPAQADAFRLARELGVADQLFKPHRLDAVAPKVGRASKLLKTITEEFREQLQKVGHLEGVKSSTGYLPHVMQAPLIAAMKKKFPKAGGLVERVADNLMPSTDFDPLKRRTMAPVVDAQNVRAAAQNAVDAGVHGPGMGDVRAAAAAPALADDAALRDAARQGLGGAPPPQASTLAQAPEQLAARGNGADVAFSANPARVFGTYGNAANPVIQSARMGQMISEATLSNGQKLVESVADVAARDAGLAQKFFNNNGSKRLPAFEIKNGIPHLHGDIVKVLDSKGLTFVSPHSDLARRIPAFSGKVMPKVVAREMEDVLTKVVPGSVEKVIKAIMGPINRLWVPVVLNTPGFHVRNAVFGFFQSYLAMGSAAFSPGLFRNAQRVADAAATGAGLEGVVQIGGRQERIADLVKLAEKNGVYEGGRVADLRRAMGGKASYSSGNAVVDAVKHAAGAANPWSKTTALPQGPLFEVIASRLPAGVGAGRPLSTGATMENVQRLQVFLHELGQGKAPHEAAQQVMKYMFDYTGSSLSRIERSVRQLVPFYQWIRYSSQQMVEQVLKQPEKYAQVNRIYDMIDRAGSDINYDPREIPSYVRDQGLVSSPFKDDTQDAAAFVGYERPGVQLSGAANIMGSLSPAAAMLIESQTGKTIYGDQPLDPNYDEELDYRDGAMGVLDALGDPVNVSGEKAPGYYLGKLGGVPGFLGGLALQHLAPELAPLSARRSGQDATQRVADRMISMLGGPRQSTVAPAAVRGQTSRIGTEAQEKSDKRAGARSAAGLSPDALAAIIDAIINGETQ